MKSQKIIPGNGATGRIINGAYQRREVRGVMVSGLTKAPVRPDLFLATADHQPAAPRSTADSRSLSRTTTGRPKRRVISVQAPPRKLIKETRRAGPRQQHARDQPTPDPRKDAPVIGVRVQGSSATNVRKLAALLTEPPSRPSQTQPRTATSATKKDVVSASSTAPSTVNATARSPTWRTRTPRYHQPAPGRPYRKQTSRH